MTVVPSPAELAPKPPGVGPLAWMRQNLFNSVGNAITTIIVVLFIAWLAPKIYNWAWTNAVFEIDPKKCREASGACWGFVAEKYRLMLFGLYTFAEQWRPLLVSIVLVTLIVVTLNTRLWGRLLWGSWLILLPVMFYVMLGGSVSLGYLPLILVGVAVLLGLPLMPVLGLAGLLVALFILRSFGLPIPLPEMPTLLVYVEIDKWGGLPLTLILAAVGNIVSFPLAILLALGRRSNLPAIKAVCIGFIELVRGVPLITVLFMATLMIPLFLPEGVNFNTLLKALVGITLFSAAYVAEVIRGGLQAIPKGQTEAADALGLSYWSKTSFIVLPQALKLVIPPMINNFIGAFKDTSLVIIVGLVDLLGSVRAASNDNVWRAFYVEGLVFIAVIYFVFCYAMASYGKRLETSLNQQQTR
jgi:general L-amino acid transport system permease protein